MKRPENTCLAPDQIGLFIKNELAEPEREHVEKHCALCEPCREQLVEVLCALVPPASTGPQQKFPCNV